MKAKDIERELTRERTDEEIIGEVKRYPSLTNYRQAVYGMCGALVRKHYDRTMPIWTQKERGQMRKLIEKLENYGLEAHVAIGYAFARWGLFCVSVEKESGWKAWEQVPNVQQILRAAPVTFEQHVEACKPREKVYRDSGGKRFEVLRV